MSSVVSSYFNISFEFFHFIDNLPLMIVPTAKWGMRGSKYLKIEFVLGKNIRVVKYPLFSHSANLVARLH